MQQQPRWKMRTNMPKSPFIIGVLLTAVVCASFLAISTFVHQPLQTTPSSLHGATDDDTDVVVFTNIVLQCSTMTSLQSDEYTFEDGKRFCSSNPSCVAFTVYPDGQVVICRGRAHQLGAVKKPHMDAVSGIPAHCKYKDHGGYIAVDCGNTHRNFQRCRFMNSETSVCLIDALIPVILGSNLQPTRSSYLCQKAHGRLTIMPQKPQNGLGCEWEVEDELELRARSTHSQELLFPDLLQYTTQGFLQQSSACICDNHKSGLVVGPYCGNEDCMWHESAVQGCHYQNAKTKNCITELMHISNHELAKKNALKAKYICTDGEALFISGQATAPSCHWTSSGGGQLLINNQTKQSFREVLRLSSGHDLLVHPQQCMCHEKGKGLYMSQSCNNRACVWLPGGQPLTLVESSLQRDFSYDVQSIRFDCAISLNRALHLTSMVDALQMCKLHPKCTYVAYGYRDGRTLLCQGHFKGIGVKDEVNDIWFNAFRGACNGYTEEGALNNLGVSKEPSCKHVTCTCPSNSNLIISCDYKRNAVCDECPDGYCGTWPNSKVVTGFGKPLQNASLFQLDNSFKGFNPSLTSHAGAEWVGFRMANNTYCDDYSYQNQDAQVYMSHIGVCQMDHTTHIPIPDTCRRVRVDAVSVIRAHGYQEHPIFHGIEDPRLFSYNGSLFISGTVMLFSSTSRGSNREYTRIGMFRVNKQQDATDWGVILSPDSTYERLRQKNWMALVDSQNRLQFVTDFTPLTIVTPDLKTGRCKTTFVASSGSDAVPTLAGGHLRGGPAFVRLNNTFMTVAHKRNDYPMGPIYTHYLVFIREHPQWEISYVSPGFRFPDEQISSVQDIQFAVGLLLKGSDVLVSYGVADCFSAVAKFEDFWDTLRQMISQGRSNLAAPPVVAAPKPGELSIRWEGPILDMSSFAVVARSLTKWMARDATFTFFDVENLHLEGREEPMPHIKTGLIRTNGDHFKNVDFVVRLQWPLNLERSHHATYTIVYLPWEFYYIPHAWVEKLNMLDDVWVPTTYVKDGFVASGVQAKKVHVLPHGVDVAQVCSGTPRPPKGAPKQLPLGLTTRKHFIFLYQSGALWRKGLDTVLHAYMAEFSASDDVLLVVHSIYGDGEVVSMLDEIVTSAMRNYSAPHLARISTALSMKDHSLLRSSADTFVMPTRAEGFGLTIAEAMACGLPVITTDKGAHREFVDDSMALLVNSTQQSCNRYPCVTGHPGQPPSVFGFEMPHDPVWFEPDVGHLRRQMRYAATHHEQMSQQALKARQHIATSYKWADMAHLATKRLETRGFWDGGAKPAKPVVR